MNWWKQALDLVFPRCCPACGTYTGRDTLWCDECFKKALDAHQIQRNSHPHLAACYTTTHYEGSVRRLIIALKYNQKPQLAKALYPILDAFPWWERLAAETDLAVPIPLSAARRRERGYNQTDLLFRDILQDKSIAYDPDGLVRIRNTPKQSLLNKEAREKNLQMAFHVNKGKDIRGKRILLVDDIYTTGTTMETAAQELCRAGAVKVIGLTVASGAV